MRILINLARNANRREKIRLFTKAYWIETVLWRRYWIVGLAVVGVLLGVWLG